MSARQYLNDIGVFRRPGAYVLFDGQFGSTGKGLVAGWLAQYAGDRVDLVTSNAGPNSGHTSYLNDEKIVLCQLPTLGVHAHKMGQPVPVQMNAGAIIDPGRLRKEIVEDPMGHLVSVNPYAAVVNENALASEAHLKDVLGSTGKGTGAALAAKVMRWPSAVAQGNREDLDFVDLGVIDPRGKTVFVEVSQGHSLGINQGFYPYTTSRDCGVLQALSDAGIHPMDYRMSIMCVRTFPIRVGGNSGPAYEDQDEISWASIGQQPELTTVTQKKRRLFTWSRTQFLDAVDANRPNVIFLNFCNYLRDMGEDVYAFVEREVVAPYEAAMGRPPSVVLGWGPRNSDVEVYQ